MDYSHYTDDQKRVLVDCSMLYEEYNHVLKEYYNSYRYYMFWQKNGGDQYLVKEDAKSIDRAIKKRTYIGPRSIETVRILEQYSSAKEKIHERISNLQKRIHEKRGVLKATRVGFAPSLLISIYKKINEFGLDDKVIVAGTNSLYVYGAMYGVFFAQNNLATEDIDILSKKQVKLSVMFKELMPSSGAVELIKAIDKNFVQSSQVPYRFVNKEGCILELLNPLSKKITMKSYKEMDHGFTNIIGLEMEGSSWLENSRIVKCVVPDISGSMAIISAIHPLEFSIFKNWLSKQENRNPLKKSRDYAQSRILLDLLLENSSHETIELEVSRMKHFKNDVLDDWVKNVYKDALLSVNAPTVHEDTPMVLRQYGHRKF